MARYGRGDRSGGNQLRSRLDRMFAQMFLQELVC
jgi:hypothetical protein